MRLVAFGAGYVGLVTGTGLSELGHDVLVVDIDPVRIEKLKDGVIPIYEPGLTDLVRRNERAGRLTFSSKVEPGYDEADIYFICVGTPPDANGAADVSAVMAVADTIASIAKKDALVAVKSTVPVGTGDGVQARLMKGSVRLEAASNPEFLKEGAAVNDFFRPDRIILGADSQRAHDILRELYAPLQLSGERVVMTDRRSSELIKYAANTMLAMRVSFMNELSRVCDALGADVHAVRAAVGSDVRIGPKFLYAGPGYGGSCFPKDVSALAMRARDAGVPLEVVEAAGRANEAQKAYVRDRAIAALEGGPKGKVVAVWGVAFKAETDDVRETPAAPLVSALVLAGAKVRIHDPEAAQNFVRTFSLDVEICEDEFDAAKGADLVVVMTEWHHLRNPDFERLGRLMRTKTLFDARNIWSTFDLNQRGFRYFGVGTVAGRPGR